MSLRAVLDEAVPKKLAALPRERGYDVAPFPLAWKGAKNGRLLTMIEADGFEALVTCDKNLRHQQSFRLRRVALVVLPEQSVPRLRPVLEPIADALQTVQPGQIVVIDRAGRAVFPPSEA